MAGLYQDFRYAFRGLKNSPIFTAVAVFSIALGIGANTAIFTFVDQILLRLLPVRDPQQLVLLTSVGSTYGNNRGGNALSYPMYTDFRDHNQAFSGMFCRFDLPFSVTYNGTTERAVGELVSGTYFQVLGVDAAVGRTFTPDDDKTPDGHPVVMLSYNYWKTRFSGNPNVIGKRITINNYPMTIVGVSQEGFNGTDIGYAPQIRVPVMMKAQMTPQWNDLDNRRSRWLNVFGRLKPGVDMARAKASLQPYFHSILEMEVKEAAFANASPYTKEQFLKSSINLLPGSQGRSELRRDLTRPLWVLMAIVGLVLLIACANVANLLVARASTRQKEIAVRLALGAGRGRIIRQLLVESVVLAVIGGVAGLLLASWTDHALFGFLPAEDRSNIMISTAPDMRVMAFTFAISLFTGLLFGLAPALQATNPDLAPTMKDEAGSVVGGSHGAVRKVLVVAQVMLSLILLIAAGLFIRSLRNLKKLDPGFKTENVIAFSLDPTLNGYTAEQARAFYKRLTDELNHVPGVKSAALTAMGLLEGGEWDSTVTVEGYEAKPGEDMNPFCNAVSPGYFNAMNIPLLAGRDFSRKDELLAPPPEKDFGSSFRVAIASEKFVRHYFGNSNPIGRHIGLGGDPGTKTPIEIIGVVKDSKYTSLRDEVPRQLYFPYLESDFVTGMNAYVRTSGDPEQMFRAMRYTLGRIDPNVPSYNMRTMDLQLNQSLLTERLVATLSSAFGLLATLLAIVGLYGVMAFSVARRTREIGIRIALGAITGNVIWMVMREVLLLIGIGVAVGLPLAWGLSHLVESQVYGIAPSDPMTIALATIALATVACGAGYLPALRASRVDPIVALRYE